MNHYQMPVKQVSYSLDNYHDFLLLRMRNFVQGLLPSDVKIGAVLENDVTACLTNSSCLYSMLEDLCQVLSFSSLYLMFRTCAYDLIKSYNQFLYSN